MKRGVSLFLLVLILFTHTEFRQLRKIPFMISHYENDHKSEGMGIVEFFVHHYSNADHHYPDYEKDQKLPFKTCDYNYVNACTGEKISGYDVSTLLIKGNPVIFKSIYLESKSEIQFGNVWQPPKMA